MQQNLWRDTRAIAYVWALGLIALVLGAVIYFPMSYAWDAVYASIVGQYVFTGVTAEGISVIQIIISYLMAFMAVFVVNWIIVNSKSEAYGQ